MVKKQTPKRKKQPVEADSTYFLKLVLYMFLGATWIKFATPLNIGSLHLNGAPIGMLFGILLASRDQFSIDRKIEYAILLIMTILTFFLPVGVLL